MSLTNRKLYEVPADTFGALDNKQPFQPIRYQIAKTVESC